VQYHTAPCHEVLYATRAALTHSGQTILKHCGASAHFVPAPSADSRCRSYAVLAAGAVCGGSRSQVRRPAAHCAGSTHLVRRPSALCGCTGSSVLGPSAVCGAARSSVRGVAAHCGWSVHFVPVAAALCGGSAHSMQTASEVGGNPRSSACYDRRISHRSCGSNCIVTAANDTPR
jgi:hypothetical protein